MAADIVPLSSRHPDTSLLSHMHAALAALTFGGYSWAVDGALVDAYDLWVETGK